MYTTTTYFGPGVAAVDLHLLNSERNDLLVEDILPLKINTIELSLSEVNIYNLANDCIALLCLDLS